MLNMNVNQIKNPSQNFRDRDLIFIDLETTGLSVLEHEILEIGALKVENKRPFKVLEELEIKIKPKNLEKADKTALKIVGFSEEEWKDAIDLEEGLKLLEKFGEGGVLAGYNVSFDWAMLNKAYFNLGKVEPFYYQRVDVMSMAFDKLQNQQKLKRFSLGEVARFFDIKQDSYHRALADIKITHEVFKKLLEVT